MSSSDRNGAAASGLSTPDDASLASSIEASSTVPFSTGVFASNAEYQNRSSWGPLLISVGPYCCGKSTFVDTLAESNVATVSIPDRPDLFETVPLSVALEIGARADKAVGELKAVSERVAALKMQKSLDISVFDRIERIAVSEKMLIALVFNHQITIDFFRTRMMILLKGQTFMMVLLECVMELLKKRTVMTCETMKIDIEEAVTESRAAAIRELEGLVRSNAGVISFEDLNLNPADYYEVLQMCDKYGRVVRFVRWGQELRAETQKELLMRNLLRFLKTGRYVPIAKMVSSYEWAQQLLTKRLPTHVDLAKRAEKLRLQPEKSVTQKLASVLGKSGKSADDAAAEVLTRWSRWTNDGLVFRIDGLQPFKLQKKNTIAIRETLNPEVEPVTAADAIVKSQKARRSRNLDRQGTDSESEGGKGSTAYTFQRKTNGEPVAGDVGDSNPWAWILCGLV